MKKFTTGTSPKCLIGLTQTQKFFLCMALEEEQTDKYSSRMYGDSALVHGNPGIFRKRFNVINCVSWPDL